MAFYLLSTAFNLTGKTSETWFYRMDMPKGYKNFSKISPVKREHFAPVDEWWKNRREIQYDGGTFNSRKYTADEIIAGGVVLTFAVFRQTRK